MKQNRVIGNYRYFAQKITGMKQVKIMPLVTPLLKFFLSKRDNVIQKLEDGTITEEESVLFGIDLFSQNEVDYENLIRTLIAESKVEFEAISGEDDSLYLLEDYMDEPGGPCEDYTDITKLFFWLLGLSFSKGRE